MNELNQRYGYSPQDSGDKTGDPGGDDHTDGPGGQSIDDEET